MNETINTYIQNDLFIKKYPFYIYQLNKIYNYINSEKNDIINNKSYFSSDIMEKIISKINLLENNQPRVNKAFHLCHLGLGDIIQMIGAIRYLSILYDEVLVISARGNYENVKSFFQDDESIKFYLLDGIDADLKINPNTSNGSKLFQELTKEYTNVYISGPCFGHKNNKWDDTGDCFYKDLNFDIRIRFDFFFVPITEESLKLYSKISNIDYIFIQQKYSTGFRNLISWNIDDILTIDSNINVYNPDHKWYSLCNEFLNKPMIQYVKLIQEAKELHLLDSSFSCLAATIPTKAKIKYRYERNSGQIIKQFKFVDY